MKDSKLYQMESQKKLWHLRWTKN